MTVIFFIMLFFVPSYIIGKRILYKANFPYRKESFSNKTICFPKRSLPLKNEIPFRVMSWNVENLFDTARHTKER